MLSDGATMTIGAGGLNISTPSSSGDPISMGNSATLIINGAVSQNNPAIDRITFGTSGTVIYGAETIGQATNASSFVGVANYILGVDPTEVAPKIALPDESRPIPEPYVVIAVQASSLCKMWNNPFGWREVIASLRKRGYPRLARAPSKPRRRQGVAQ